jgi:bisphosphoglycerate-dependent phosphoglycerate mutase
MHKGALQGKEKNECVEKYGLEEIKMIRTSYSCPPPMIDIDDKDHPRFDDLYSDYSLEEKMKMPRGESIEMV